MPKSYFPSTLFAFTLLGIVNCGSTASDGIPANNGSAGARTSGGGSANNSAGSGNTSGGSGTVVSGAGAAGTSTSSGGASGAGTSAAGASGTNPGGGGSAGAISGGGTTSSGGSTSGGGATSSGGSTSGGGTTSSGGTTGGAGAAGHAGSGAAGAAGSTGNSGPCDVWVSPTGSDTNVGTQASPVLTPQHAYDILCPGVTGSANGDLCSGNLTTMCLMAGTYNLSTRIEFKKTRMGTSSRIITMMADPAATTKPILNFAGQPRLTCGENPTDKNIYGIDMGADWYRVKNLEVENANDSGILVQGAHDFVENCVVHGSEDTGVLVNSSSGYTGSGSYATITNVDSYQNIDKRCNGANADGFGAKKGSGVGNVFDGCRSWDNADDGFDLFAWTDPVTIKNSWAFNQGATYSGSESNGNGFKMGGGSVSAKHIMSGLFGFDNNGNGGHKADWGFTNNSNPASMTCTGCNSWNNGGGQWQNIAHTGDVSVNTTSAKAAAAKRNADGSLPAITSL